MIRGIVRGVKQYSSCPVRSDILAVKVVHVSKKRSACLQEEKCQKHYFWLNCRSREVVGYILLLFYLSSPLITFMNMLSDPLGPISNLVTVITVGVNLPAVRVAVILTVSATWLSLLPLHKNHTCTALHQLYMGHTFLICLFLMHQKLSKNTTRSI